MLPNEDDLNARKSHLVLLLQMANVDGSYHVNEDKMIRQIAQRLGFSTFQFEQLKKHPDDVKFTVPQTEDERIVVLYHLLFLMRIDQVISSAEKELCREMGFRLGLNPLMIEDMIELMVKHLDEKLPDKALLETVRRYRN